MIFIIFFCSYNGEILKQKKKIHLNKKILICEEVTEKETFEQNILMYEGFTRLKDVFEQKKILMRMVFL